jgi:hypothetical protein
VLAVSRKNFIANSDKILLNVAGMVSKRPAARLQLTKYW